MFLLARPRDLEKIFARFASNGFAMERGVPSCLYDHPGIDYFKPFFRNVSFWMEKWMFVITDHVFSKLLPSFESGFLLKVIECQCDAIDKNEFLLWRATSAKEQKTVKKKRSSYYFTEGGMFLYKAPSNKDISFGSSLLAGFFFDPGACVWSLLIQEENFFYNSPGATYDLCSVYRISADELNALSTQTRGWCEPFQIISAGEFFHPRIAPEFLKILKAEIIDTKEVESDLSKERCLD